MDFLKLPRQLIYRDRRSLEEFTRDNEMNTALVNDMLDIKFLQTPDFKERVLACMNEAYYICTLIKAEPHPEWSLPQYFELPLISLSLDRKSQILTLTLVQLYLTTFERKWFEDHSSLIERFKTMTREEFGLGNNDIYVVLHTPITALASFPSDQFEPRTIDHDTIEEVLNSSFRFAALTEGYKESIMREIVFEVGKDEHEMELLLKLFYRDAEFLYGKDDLRYETVFNRTGEISHDVFLYCHDDDLIRLEESADESTVTSDERQSFEARIRELESINATLNAKVEQLEARMDENEITQEQLDGIFGKDSAPVTSIGLTPQQNDATRWKAEAERLQEELEAYKERTQNRGGINQLQTAYLGVKLAKKLDINVTNKKKLAPALSKLFGWGERKLEQEMSHFAFLSDEKKLELANIIGDFSPEFAKYICPKWQGTPPADNEAPPAE